MLATLAGGVIALTPIDSSYIAQIIQSAGAGTALMLILLLIGIVQTKTYTQRVEKEADQWHAAWEAEHKAREELALALAAERQRADAAVETAKIATDVLEGLRGRMHAADPKGP